jgi:aminopeptidase C
MWIFTRDGFFSAVEYIRNTKQHKAGDLVLVRARYRNDLEQLLKRLRYPVSGIKNTPQADYPYRTLVTKKAWAEYVKNTAEHINYPNFKDEVLKDATYDRSERYHNVWAAMAGYGY